MKQFILVIVTTIQTQIISLRYRSAVSSKAVAHQPHLDVRLCLENGTWPTTGTLRADGCALQTRLPLAAHAVFTRWLDDIEENMPKNRS